MTEIQIQYKLAKSGYSKVVCRVHWKKWKFHGFGQNFSENRTQTQMAKMDAKVMMMILVKVAEQFKLLCVGMVHMDF